MTASTDSRSCLNSVPTAAGAKKEIQNNGNNKSSLRWWMGSSSSMALRNPGDLMVAIPALHPCFMKKVVRWGMHLVFFSSSHGCHSNTAWLSSLVMAVGTSLKPRGLL